MSTTSRVRRTGTALLPVALSGALLVVPGAAAQTGAAPDETRAAAQTRAAPDDHVWTVHSSDGRPGPIAPPLPEGRFFANQQLMSSWSYQVAPGVKFRRWFWKDARGPVRAQLLRIDLDRGFTLDHLASRLVPKRDTPTRLVTRRGAIGGVNGDFFDIRDTGAPLGNARGRRSGLRSAAPAGDWTKSFWIEPDGHARIGRPHLQAHVRGKPWLRIDHWNSPTVQPGNVGVYRSSWGWTGGRRVVDGQRRNLREVVVRQGRVRSNRPWLSMGRRIKAGFVLVGRGRGANRLRSLRPGSRVRLDRHLSRRAAVAISGSVILRKRGRDNTIDDREMHPRTAIGIDRDTNRILLAVVDGRYRGSRGLTMKETSELMRRLGAEVALNLDGGGSSTMVARKPNGRLAVMNRPSDGHQRRVPNALGVVRR